MIWIRMRRDHLQFPEKCLDVLRLLSLNGTHDDVFPSLLPTPRFIQHAIGLAYTGRVAKKNLEFRTPLLAFLRLHLLEEPLGTRSGEFGYAHFLNSGKSVNRHDVSNKME